MSSIVCPCQKRPHHKGLFLFLKVFTFAVVKIKDLLSVSLIFLVILSSIGYGEGYSQNSLGKCQSGKATETQLGIESMDAPHEFLESLKISVSGEIESYRNFIFHSASDSNFTTISHLQYNCYLREHLSKSPSKKLFIDFGALII